MLHRRGDELRECTFRFFSEYFPHLNKHWPYNMNAGELGERKNAGSDDIPTVATQNESFFCVIICPPAKNTSKSSFAPSRASPTPT